MGWSTLALGLLNPQGKVLAIDAGLDRNSLAGIDFTNAAALQEALPVTVLRAGRPRMWDMSSASRRCFRSISSLSMGITGPSRWRSISARCGRTAVNGSICSMTWRPLRWRRRSSGSRRRAGFRRVCCPARIPAWHCFTTRRDCPLLLDDIAPFSAAPAVLQTIREAAWSHRHRHLARWRRSVAKRLGTAGRRCPAMTAPDQSRLLKRLIGYRTDERRPGMARLSPAAARPRYWPNCGAIGAAAMC